jgi:hypothetical protein
MGVAYLNLRIFTILKQEEMAKITLSRVLQYATRNLNM